MISGLYALNVSVSITSASEPSTVYAKSAPNFLRLKFSTPVPISSSGVNAIFYVGLFNSGLSLNTFNASIISAIPALSSAPKREVPSDVIIV